MAPRTTKAKSVEQENDIAKAYGGRRTSASGANPSDLGDVVATDYLIEAKYTEGKSLSLSRAVWNKIHDEAYTRGRTPLMALRFRDPDKRQNLDLIVMDINDHLELLDATTED